MLNFLFNRSFSTSVVMLRNTGLVNIVKKQFSNLQVPIKKWTSAVEPIEETAMQQIENLSKMGSHIIHGHIAIMPDVHMGIGATIGTVLPTKNVIIPGAVG